MRTLYPLQKKSLFLFLVNVLFFGCLSGSMAAGDLLVFPIPQQMEILKEEFTLDESVRVIVPQKPDDKDLYFAHSLIREMSNKYGLALNIAFSDKIPDGKNVVVIGNMDNPLIRSYCSENNLSLTKKDPGKEGYVLNVTKNRIVVAGWDDAGAFYGLQSLRQLIENGKGEKVQGVKIRDWPRLPFRAIRMYVPGPENFPFFKRFLRDFMALYKFNHVILELNCMRLDEHPEINAGWVEFAKALRYSRKNRAEGKRGEGQTSSHYDAGDGQILEKEEVRELVDFASENFIEVIPEIPSLTHTYYLLTRHPELAEYPGTPWPDTYCPSNPASYDLIYDVYKEYIDVIHPKMINIGHDEWRVPLDVCPRCKGKNYYDLYALDVNKIYNYLSVKGVNVAMWGDHLLENVRNKGPREGTTSTGIKYKKPGALPPEVVEKSIPKDILILNWFWDDENNDIALDKFGFTQAYGNMKPNIQNWDERIKKVHVIGGSPSSWAATDEYNIGKDLLFDFLGCANLLWSPHTLDQLDLVPVVWKLIPSVRTYLSGTTLPSDDHNPVEPLDISSHYNFTTGSKVFDIDLSTLKKGKVSYGNKIFNLTRPGNNPGACAIATGSVGPEKNPLPSAVEGIPVNEDVTSLIFLQACALPARNMKAYYNMPDFFDTPDLLGWYEIIYEDGFKAVVPIQYGVNILEWNAGGEHSLDKLIGKTGSDQHMYCYEGDPVACSADMKNHPIYFFAYEWVNPRFGKKIKTVNVYGSVHYQSTVRAGNPETRPMPDNAILLVGISKVKKREYPGKVSSGK